MRALYTAASGMRAQQLNVDTISNNLANVNTVAYKKSRVEFKDVLYQTLQKGTAADENGKPVSIQVGNGVMPSATLKTFTKGNVEPTENPLDFFIDGDGFFAVRASNDQIFYTKDGSFKLGATEDGTLKLVTADGYSVLDSGDNEIFIEVQDPSNIVVDGNGSISYINADGETITADASLKIVKFLNPVGLDNKGMNLFMQTGASGEAINEEDLDGNEMNVRSVIRQGFLETSNVQVVDEMVKLIVAQRSYEVNSKSVQTADEMWQMANSIRR